MLGKPYKIRLETDTYRTGGTAVFAVEEDTGEQFCTLSVNLPETCELPDGAWYGKHWSENEGFLAQLVMQGVISPVPCLPAQSGFVNNILAYRLNDWPVSGQAEGPLPPAC